MLYEKLVDMRVHLARQTRPEDKEKDRLLVDKWSEKVTAALNRLNKHLRGTKGRGRYFDSYVSVGKAIPEFITIAGKSYHIQLFAWYEGAFRDSWAGWKNQNPSSDSQTWPISAYPEDDRPHALLVGWTDEVNESRPDFLAVMDAQMIVDGGQGDRSRAADKDIYMLIDKSAVFRGARTLSLDVGTTTDKLSSTIVVRPFVSQGGADVREGRTLDNIEIQAWWWWVFAGNANAGTPPSPFSGRGTFQPDSSLFRPDQGTGADRRTHSIPLLHR